MESPDKEIDEIYTIVAETFRDVFQLSASDMSAIEENSPSFSNDPIRQANLLLSVQSLLLNLYRNADNPSVLASSWLKSKEIGRQKETALDILKSGDLARIEKLKAFLSFSIPIREWKLEPWI